MKKIVLSLTGVLAATAFAPEASAIPAFARQTGMACSACHFQHFPVLNGFGQAFKASGFTLMGAQGRVEGEHLSIPDTLNAAVLAKLRYQKSNGTDAPNTVSGTTTNGGQWQIPDELSLFFGGRVADNETLKIGMMMENNLAAAGAPLISGLRLPIVYEMDAVKLLAIPYATDSLGAGYGFELNSAGAVRGVRWAENRTDISAAQYVGVGATAATGLAFVAHSDMGYINVSRYSPNFTMGPDTGTKMTSNWIRLAYTPTVADWAMNIGLVSLSGSNYVAPTTFGAEMDTKGTIVDFQAQGVVAEREMSVYAQYATAPKSTAGGRLNYYNQKSNISGRKAATIGVEYSVIPHTLHVGLAYLSANAGKKTDISTDKETSVTVTAAYDVAQNVALVVNHSMRGGNIYDATTGDKAGNVAVGGTGKTLTTLMLEGAW